MNLKNEILYVALNFLTVNCFIFHLGKTPKQCFTKVEVNFKPKIIHVQKKA